jgi:type II secretory pathway pseudopilin PulG
VLLEVLASLSILAVAGLATLRLLQGSALVASEIRTADTRIARASAFLEAVALWPTGDLDRRLGRRVQGEWKLYIERRGDTYAVTLYDTASARALLTTTLYRRLPKTVTR